MNTMRTLSSALVVTLALASAAIPAGSSSAPHLGCGPVVAIRDPELKASFVRFDAGQSASARSICAVFRNDMPGVGVN